MACSLRYNNMCRCIKIKEKLEFVEYMRNLCSTDKRGGICFKMYLVE